MNDTEKVIEKILTSDARTKAFRKKLLKLGYVKQAKDAAQIMEKIADFGMMSDTGNKKVARAVAQAKDKNDLKKRLEKIHSYIEKETSVISVEKKIRGRF